MTNLDEYVPHLDIQDTKKRIQLGDDIIKYLENPVNSIECEEFAGFVDSVASWLNSSNFKVSQNGLTILTLLADRMKDDFRPYISTVLSATVDRMGDSKDQVREQAKEFLLKLMSDVSSPQHMFEKLMPVFNHKNWKVREEILICLQDTLVRHGSHSLTLSKLMPSVVKLLSDPNSQVRETANNTVVEIYKHVGEKVRHDLMKKYNIPAAKLQGIFAKFDEIKTSGAFLPSASFDPVGHRGDDDIDSGSQSSKSSAKRASSAPPPRRAMLSTPKHTPSSSMAAGAADEEMFMRAFDDVPRVQLYSGRELENELGKIKETLSDPNNDWGKRVEAMKRLRSLIIAGAIEYEELFPSLRQLEVAFQSSLKDLRSQVVREACITIAYLSQQLGIKFDHFSEAVLQCLISLIPNCAKIMSTAGIVAIRFIIQHTHGSRLIPIITSNLTSKSKEIRKVCCEFLDQLLHTWPTHTLERHIAILQEAIRKGLSDADPEARAYSRKAFWGFADHFKEQADSLLSSLDSSKQRMLQGGLSLSSSSSNNSLSGTGKSGSIRHGSSSTTGSVENLSRTSGRRSGIPIFNSPKTDSKGYIPSPFRSNSAIDVAAAKRAKARAYGMSTHLVRGSGASLPRRDSRRDNTLTALTSPERLGRSRAKGASQSQPSSRSGSPSSRLSYNTYQEAGSSGRVRRKSGIPMATGTSRETSPTRSLHGGHERRLSGSYRSRPFLGAGERHHPTTIITSAPVMAEKILQQSKEAESAMADALVSDGVNYDPYIRISSRRRFSAFDDQSDESETSSVCSDRSFSSYGGRHIDDVPEIIYNLGSIHWSERKEGLIGLCALLRSSRMLSLEELKRVTDIFTKMFMDPHTKVFTLFLDALHELIHVHQLDLHGWLYILLTRLFVKSGTDTVTSVQTKIKKTLDLIRDSFPSDDLFHIIIRFLNDPTQTPNNKVKMTVLHFLHSLLRIMDPNEFSSSSHETKQAITKIISWTADPKNNDLRKFAQDVIIGLFNVNTPEFSMLLNQLSKSYQDSAFKLLSSRRRGSMDSNSAFNMRSPPSPITATLHSPNTAARYNRSRSGTPQDHLLSYEDTESLNPEEIYNSLKMTSAEIQKYSLDTYEKDFNSKDGRQKIKDAWIRDSVSQDSGISQSSVPDGRQDLVQDRLKYFRMQSPKCSPFEYSPTHYKEQVLYEIVT
ncbi:CLIP-associating protein 1-A-like isoform X5 [Limulus polyphemus]|uniref:CLIP-associating protein 1-A-like isoform X5 n=1 Tax=Limulus polyphemus TaxID=6850 RepID=A0ABM1B2L8_LIMPO|nr:CLIP-associating protein 1-A-like isoform X5 [Limulus polyphemus]